MHFATIRRAAVAVVLTIGVFIICAGYFLWRLPPTPPAKSAERPAVELLPSGSGSSCEERYLALLKRYLIRSDFGPIYSPADLESSASRRLLRRTLSARGLVLTRIVSPEAQESGSHWPPTAETMIGVKRLDNLHECVIDVLRRKVDGDLIECGAWRGGATIFMRAILEAYKVKDRNVWVADSFEGLPKPDERKYPVDKGDELWRHQELAVSVDQVKANFKRYGLLDEQVKFLVGWFKDTLPRAPINKLAVLRVDADLYQSTWEALQYLYPKLSIGGYCIIDDYGALLGCKKAVDDFRKANNITSELKTIDWTGVYWQRLQ